jgi:hypothetical protein
MPFRSFIFPLISFVAALSVVASAGAHEYNAGPLRIGHPYARATVPNQSTGGAYLSIENSGKNPDKLVAVASPIANSIGIHTMSMDGNVMRMREVSGIEIKPSDKVVMQPGNGYHIMLTGLKQPLKAGDKFPLTLTFEKAGKVDVSVMVQDKDKEPKAAKEAAAHQQH